MSFPNIPDINPDISVTFDDAINLLLTSVAMEEISLSKLIDAETDKIKCVVDSCICRKNECIKSGNKPPAFHEIIEVNKSVDDTIKNMIKLQMLLQFKLENIEKIRTKTTSTTSTSTTTSTTSTCSTTTNKICDCSLAGEGKGCVSNCCDIFHNSMATLCTFLSCEKDKRIIKYSVRNSACTFYFRALGCNIKRRCPRSCSDSLVVKGTGDARIFKHCNPFKTTVCFNGQVDFRLTVCNKPDGLLEFRMEIWSQCNPEIKHDSGFVQTNICSNLQLKICC